MYNSVRTLIFAASVASSLATISPTTHVRNVANHVLASTVTPPPRPRFDRSLRKRAEWVSVCADGATNCPIIGISDIMQEADGNHYIPMCDSTSCQWIGYAEPSSKVEGSTSYSLSSTADTHIIIPVILPPGGEPVIIPPGGEGDGPDGPIEDFSTISPPSKTCSTVSTSVTVTELLTFAQDSWNTETGALAAETLAWLDYFDVICPASKRPCVAPEATPTEPSAPPSADPTPTPKSAPYAEGTCRISVQLDQWPGDRDSIPPFWMHVTGMTDNAGKNLRGTEDEAGWQKCGASEPGFADTVLEDRFIMRPILAPDSSVPYVHFEAGAQNWRSDQVGELNKGAVPACTMVPCLSCEGP